MQELLRESEEAIIHMEWAIWAIHIVWSTEYNPPDSIAEADRHYANGPLD